MSRLTKWNGKNGFFHKGERPMGKATGVSLQIALLNMKTKESHTNSLL